MFDLRLARCMDANDPASDDDAIVDPARMPASPGVPERPSPLYQTWYQTTRKGSPTEKACAVDLCCVVQARVASAADGFRRSIRLVAPLRTQAHRMRRFRAQVRRAVAVFSAQCSAVSALPAFCLLLFSLLVFSFLSFVRSFFPFFFFFLLLSFLFCVRLFALTGFFITFARQWPR